jgi:hypothetical protein
MSVDFLKLLQGCSLPTSYNIGLQIFMFPFPLGSTRMWCWKEEIPGGYFSKKLNENARHSCEEPVKFS